jgi:hypothetical protein
METSTFHFSGAIFEFLGTFDLVFFQSILQFDTLSFLLAGDQVVVVLDASCLPAIRSLSFWMLNHSVLLRATRMRGCTHGNFFPLPIG